MDPNLSEEDHKCLKEFCALLRESQTLSEPTREENGGFVCNVIPDPVAAQAADVIEELVKMVTKLEYELKESKSV